MLQGISRLSCEVKLQPISGDDLTSVNKVRGSSCVYDRELFMLSDRKLGFDFCWGGLAKKEPAQGGMHGHLGNVGAEFSKGARFNGGILVLEDDFDTWSGPFSDLTSGGGDTDVNTWRIWEEGAPQQLQRRSALWENMTNAASSTACGAHSGNRSLWFSLPYERWATTLPLDVRYGGVITFRMKLAPEPPFGEEATNPCKPAYSGDVEKSPVS